MPYQKYLKPGQKVLLHALDPEIAATRFEALTAFVEEQSGGCLDLELPYQTREGEDYPFTPGMTFELLSDALGLGVRLTVAFREWTGPSRIRLSHNSDLQLIRRRKFPRREATLGLRYTKGQGKLRTFRSQWKKNVDILFGGRALDQLPAFPRCRVNLSGGGIRFPLKAPVEVAELCLLLMELPDDQPPVCALAEVVWCDERIVDGRCTAGMQFLQILETDRKRIEKFIAAGPTSEEESETPRFATA